MYVSVFTPPPPQHLSTPDRSDGKINPLQPGRMRSVFGLIREGVKGEKATKMDKKIARLIER